MAKEKKTATPAAPAATEEVNHILTEADFEKNPSLATEGLKVGDEIGYDPNATVDEEALEELAKNIELAESEEELDAITSDDETIMALVEEKRKKLAAAAETQKLEDDKAAEAAQKEFESMVDSRTLEQLEELVADLDKATDVDAPINVETAKAYIEAKYNEAKVAKEKADADADDEAAAAKGEEKTKGTHTLKRGVLAGGRYYAKGLDFDKNHRAFKTLKKFA